ncbi:611_t:CDS:2, partial [Racocetra fulgida]
YTKSKCQLYTDSIDNLKEDIYTALRKYKEDPDNHVNVINKLDKILSNFEKLFSTTEVKEFVDKLREEQEERGFDTALQVNVASACAIKALKEGPSKTKSMKRNKDDVSSEIENSSEYDERPNKIKKQTTNDIEEVIRNSVTSDESNEIKIKVSDEIEESFDKRKYTVERIVPLFKAIQSVHKEFMFDWIEVQLNCIKDIKALFPKFDMTLNKADGVGLKVSSNKEVVFIDISGGPEVTSAVVKHAKEDTEKLIKEAMFGLVSLLRDYLDKN